MTNKERIDFIRKCWGKEAVDNIVTAIVVDYPQTMTMDEFLAYCTTDCGGKCDILLTGIKKLWPHVWDAIPKDMGAYAWPCLCDTIALCGIQSED